MFFSVLGLRSTADEASGGDFDGDIYKVIYNRDVVERTNKDHPAYTPTPVPAVTSASSATPVYKQGSSAPSVYKQGPFSTTVDNQTPASKPLPYEIPHNRGLLRDFTPERGRVVSHQNTNPSSPKRSAAVSGMMHSASHPYRDDNSSIGSYSDSNIQRSSHKPDCSLHWRAESAPKMQSTPAKDRTLTRISTYPSYATPTSKPYPEYTPTPSKVRKCDTYEDQGAYRHQSPPIVGKTHLTPYLENTSININHTTSSSSSYSSGPGLSSYSTSSSSSTTSSSISSGAVLDPYTDPIGWDIMTGN